jgi:hypothetical protein
MRIRPDQTLSYPKIHYICFTIQNKNNHGRTRIKFPAGNS